jgi:hypothetical protein
MRPVRHTYDGADLPCQCAISRYGRGLNAPPDLTVFNRLASRVTFSKSAQSLRAEKEEASIGGHSGGRRVGIGTRRAQARHTRTSYRHVLSRSYERDGKICKSEIIEDVGGGTALCSLDDYPDGRVHLPTLSIHFAVHA